MLIAALCTSESARLIRDDGPPLRHDFRLPALPDDQPIDPDALPSELPQVEADLPDVVSQCPITGRKIRHKSRLADMAESNLDPARMSDEEREALLSAEVQHDSQAVVDCVMRFGYWRDNSGRLHAYASWGLCAVLELPSRQAYSRLPVTEATQAPPIMPCLPVDYGELSVFGSTPFDAINRAICHQKPAPKRTFAPVATYADSSIAATIRDIANWLRDMADCLPVVEQLSALESEVKARRIAAFVADPESYVDSL